MKKIIIYFFLASVLILHVNAQERIYSVANAHSHNDYEQAIPFWLAYNAGFGSIEADIFLENGELYVAHDKNELRKHRTLEQFYLQPLIQFMQENNGFPYKDSTRSLQLLIDVKTEALSTLENLIEKLRSHPELIRKNFLKWIITGNRPPPDKFQNYPPFIMFDGDIQKSYSSNELSKISMMSASFKNFSKWTGTDTLRSQEFDNLKQLVEKVHQLHKAIRFWETPDTKIAWHTLMQLGVDFINTDQINALADYLKPHN